MRTAVKRFVPALVYRPVLDWWRRPRRIDWGRLRRLEPLSRVFGLDRGQAIDRYYIESFLQKNSRSIQGYVMEVGDPSYTRSFGGDRVVRSDVLHAVRSNPQATLVGDLSTGQGLPVEAFDCMILTQTFHVIYNVQTAVANAYSALRPGGILLATLPGISQISRYDMNRWGDYWRFTTLSARRLFEEAFPSTNIEIKSYGNVLVAVAFLHGLAAHELSRDELEHFDADYEVLISVRAEKPKIRL